MGAASAPPEGWTRAHAAARAAWQAGDLPRAGRALQVAYRVATQAAHPEARRRSLQGLARVYRRLGKTELAEKALARAAQLEDAAPAVPTKVATPAVAAPPMDTNEALAALASGDAARRPEALEALEAAGEAGEVRAARVLGALYLEGQLVEPDLARGLAWIERAIAAGDPSSMVYRAELAERGLGVPLDLAGARELYRKAAEAGSPVAAHRLGRALAARGHAEEGEAWLTRAIEGGRVAAQVDLGVLLYRQGGRDEEAASWFLRASRAGDAEGRYNLGLCLLQGRGLLADRQGAIEFFQQAAAAGSPAAREALARLGAGPGGASAETD